MGDFDISKHEFSDAAKKIRESGNSHFFTVGWNEELDDSECEWRGIFGIFNFGGYYEK